MDLAHGGMVIRWPCSAGLVPEIQTRLHWTSGFGLGSMGSGFGLRTRLQRNKNLHCRATVIPSVVNVITAWIFGFGSKLSVNHLFSRLTKSYRGVSRIWGKSPLLDTPLSYVNWLGIEYNFHLCTQHIFSKLYCSTLLAHPCHCLYSTYGLASQWVRVCMDSLVPRSQKHNV